MGRRPPLLRLAGTALLAAFVAALALAAILIPDDPYWQGRTSARDVLYLTARFTLMGLPICLALAGLFWTLFGRIQLGEAGAALLGALAGAGVWVLILLWVREPEITSVRLLPGLLAGGVAGWGARRAIGRTEASA